MHLIAELPLIIKLVISLIAPVLFYYNETKNSFIKILILLLSIISLTLFVEASYSLFKRFTSGGQQLKTMPPPKTVTDPKLIDRLDQLEKEINKNSAKKNSPSVSKQKQLIFAAQTALRKKGCYKGKVDGIMGSETISAIAQFNSQNLDNIKPYQLNQQDILNLNSNKMFPCNGRFTAPGSILNNDDCPVFNGVRDCS